MDVMMLMVMPTLAIPIKRHGRITASVSISFIFSMSDFVVESDGKSIRQAKQRNIHARIFVQKFDITVAFARVERA